METGAVLNAGEERDDNRQYEDGRDDQEHLHPSRHADIVFDLHALTAASRLPSKAAVQRLVAVTLAGLRPPR
jgi:hypothetical protein